MKIFSIYKYNLVAARNFFKQGGWPRWLVAGLFVLILVVSSVVVFFLFKAIFDFLISQEQGLQVLTFYSVGIAFFLIFILLIITNLLFLSRQLFVGKSLVMLISFPMSPLQIFAAKFGPASVITSWPVYVVGIPTILALIYSQGLSFQVVFGSLLLLIPFVLIALFWSTFLIFILSSLLGKLTFKFVVVSLIILVPLLGYFTVDTLFPENIDLIFADLNKEVARETLLSFSFFSDALPSSWFTKGVWGLVETDTGLFWGSFALLWFVSLLSLTALLVLAKYSYLPMIQKLQEGAFFASSKLPEKAKKMAPAGFYESKLLSLVKKEVLVLVRDSKQISYVGFLLLIFFIYLFALLKVPDRKSLEPNFAAFILAGNFCFVGYIQTIISLRFLYPSISLEGKSSWILWTLPFKLDKIITAKASVYITGVILVGVALTLFTGLFFSYDWMLWAISVVSSIIVGGFVASISFALGSLFPNFNEENQEAASTSAPGLLASGVCLLAVGGFSFMLWSFFNGYFSLQSSSSFNSQPVLDFLVITAVYSAVVSWFLFYFAGKKLRRYDF
jgi:ABC-2 type transport system permease protein